MFDADTWSVITLVADILFGGGLLAAIVKSARDKGKMEERMHSHGKALEDHDERLNTIENSTSNQKTNEEISKVKNDLTIVTGMVHTIQKDWDDVGDDIRQLLLSEATTDTKIESITNLLADHSGQIKEISVGLAKVEATLDNVRKK